MSGTPHGGSDFMILAGYVARLGRWNSFDLAWKRLLKRNGLEYLHAVEHVRQRRHRQCYLSSQNLVSKYLQCGFVIRIDKKAYESRYIAGHRPNKPPLDTVYGVCFRTLMSFLIVDVPKLLDRDDIKVNIILESGDVGSADAVRIVTQVKRDLPHDTKMLGDVAFGQKTNYPGLQAADCLAYGAAQMEKDDDPGYRSFPGIEISLTEAKKLAPAVRPPILQTHLNAEVLASYKADILALVDFRRRLIQAPSSTE